jgi:hypothetical protein
VKTNILLAGLQCVPFYVCMYIHTETVLFLPGARRGRAGRGMGLGSGG